MSAAKKPSLLFVDHVFHIKTQSFHFLIEILQRDFDVTIKYVDPDSSFDVDDLMDDNEFVVLAQMDFLTTHFINMGKKVCVVQMYDGSAGLPDRHWQINRQARYLNFSVALHARALAAKAESHLVRYFPDPSKFEPVTDFSSARGFFWQRLPKSPVNLKTVALMTNGSLDQLHIHTPADDGSEFDETALEGFSCPVTTSSWFERHEDFKATLDEANIYFAPRLAEGIGHGFLEALAKGMLVLAYDLPTHNEYINNWTTGILFNKDVGPVTFDDWQAQATQMSGNAKLMMANGFAQWQKNQNTIGQFIKETPTPRVPKVLGIKHALNEMTRGYKAGLPSYTAALSKFDRLCQAFETRDLLEAEVAQAEPQDDEHLQSDIHLFMGHGNAHQFVKDGWWDHELHLRWAVASEASLEIPVVRDTTVKSIAVDVRALRQNEIELEVNGIVLGSRQINMDFQQLNFEVPGSIDISQNTPLKIILRALEEEAPFDEDMRSLVFAVRTISIEAVAIKLANSITRSS